MTGAMPAPGPLLVDVAGISLEKTDRAFLADPAVGGVILFTRNFRSRQQLIDLTSEMREARPNLLIVADYEGGRVQRFLDGFTKIPPMSTLGRAYRHDAARAVAQAHELGWLVATELAAVGLDMPLAPVTDRDHGHSEIIGHRALSDAPDAIVALGGAYAAGLAEGGSAATAKHFPGHGWVRADSHAELPVDDRQRAALAEDWQPFAELIAKGIPSVMMAHVRYPAIDPAPASLSSVWIQDILRTGLAFGGCVFCDDLSMGGAAALGDYATRTRAALAAGCDYLPVCNDRESALIARDAIADRLETGQTKRQALSETVQRNRQCAMGSSDSARLTEARAVAAELSAS